MQISWPTLRRLSHNLAEFLRGYSVGNGIAGLFIGRSDAEQIALRRLVEREDEIFRLQPGEETHLATHARADLARFRLLNARLKLSEAISERKSDRNFYATLTLGLAIFLKGPASWAEVIHFFTSL